MKKLVRIVAAILATAVVSTGTFAVSANAATPNTTDVTVGETVLLPINTTANSASLEDQAKNLAIKAGITLFGKFVPYGSSIAPALEGMLISFGLYSDRLADSTKQLNENINRLREELVGMINNLDKKLDKKTSDVLNKIVDQSYIGGLGEELDSLHTSVTGIASQINTLNNDTSLTDEERNVEIAALIGNNTSWNYSNSFVHRIRNIGNILSGKVFKDMQSRDMYQVLYDDAKRNVMFSGEAYDSIEPYIERVMYEYFYAYSVIHQCFESARKVSELKPEQVALFSETTKEKYIQNYSLKSLVIGEIASIADDIYNVDRTDSVVTHYALFKYKKEQERNIFLGKGGNGIPFTIEDNKMCGFWAGSGNDKSGIAKAVQNIESFTKKNGQLSVDETRSLYEYVCKTYPELSFTEFLSKMNLNIPSVSWLEDIDFAASTKIGGHNIGSYPSLTNETYLSVIDMDSKGGTPSYIERIISTSSANVSYGNVYITHRCNSIHLMSFEEGESIQYPAEITAGNLFKKVMSTDTSSDTSSKISPDISYSAHVQDIGWTDKVTSTSENTATAGTTGKKLRMEAVIINLNDSDGSSAVKYRAYVQGQGWQSWCTSGKVAGTEGKSLQIEALEIKLTGEYAKNYDVVYRVHCESIGWTDWVKNGQTAGTTGQNRRVEAVEIKLVPKS